MRLAANWLKPVASIDAEEVDVVVNAEDVVALASLLEALSLESFWSCCIMWRVEPELETDRDMGDLGS